MSFQDVFKKSFLEGFSGMDISAGRIMAALAVTCVLALYIFVIYRVMTRKSFYSKSFNVALAAMSVITAAIILAMQSNLVISLGMVGALSIVRFRTAIKDPMDLVFLVLENLPASRAPMMLVVNLSEADAEEELLGQVRQFSRVFRVKSRNISNGKEDLVIEVRTKKEGELAKVVSELPRVEAAALISHDGEVTF